jgi:hypothetical protein
MIALNVTESLEEVVILVTEVGASGAQTQENSRRR